MYRQFAKNLALIFLSVCAGAHAAPRALCPFEHSNASLTREGLIMTRCALDRHGIALVAGTGYTAAHSVAAEAAINCPTCFPQFDINGNNTFDDVDATIISRKLAGFSGSALTQGLTLGSGSRNSELAVLQFLADGCPSATPVIVLAAGDIADCPTTPAQSGAQQTANVLKQTPGVPVLSLGDNAYDSGTPAEFANCFEPTWGSEKPRLRPSPGNHDYGNGSGIADGYYGYFGTLAGKSGVGYYSFDVGDWHIVSLNSNVDATKGSAQELWLRGDLTNTSRQCVLAYWHHPVFTSSPRGDNNKMRDIWRTLAEFKTAVILNGHEHNYERFAKQTADGTLDAVNGIRQFIVGTGGVGLTPILNAKPNSEVRNSSNFGVLKLSLGSTSYTWKFLPTVAGVDIDSGTANCR
jgi:acid phosphatase type 7